MALITLIIINMSFMGFTPEKLCPAVVGTGALNSQPLCVHLLPHKGSSINWGTAVPGAQPATWVFHKLAIPASLAGFNQ